ncbi:hypothetical protein VTK26DRAFT_7684 [Humicola hyalothermophila]
MRQRIRDHKTAQLSAEVVDVSQSQGKTIIDVHIGWTMCSTRSSPRSQRSLNPKTGGCLENKVSDIHQSLTVVGPNIPKNRVSRKEIALMTTSAVLCSGAFSRVHLHASVVPQNKPSSATPSPPLLTVSTYHHITKRQRRVRGRITRTPLAVPT